MPSLTVLLSLFGGFALGFGTVASSTGGEVSVSFAKREGAPVDHELWSRYDAERIRMLNRNARILSNHAYNTLASTIDPLAAVKSAAIALEASNGPVILSKRAPPIARHRKRGTVDTGVNVSVGMSRRAAGTAAMDMLDYFTGVDITYVGNLTVGTPAQAFLVLPDTGSADLWVIREGTDTQHTTFDPSASSTYVTRSVVFEEQYGSGEVSGISANDTVTVGGLSVTSQSFGVVNLTDSAIEQSAFDGLLGMAFSTISELGAYTFFENAILNGELTDPVFSVYLSRGDDYLNGGSSGYLTNGAALGFGYVLTPPVALADTSLTYSDVLIEGYWEIACGGITVDGTTLTGTSFYAAIDTGTSLIYLPTTITEAFYAKFGGVALGGGQYALPASNITSLPTLGLSFGGKSFQINFDDFALQYTDSSRDYVLGAIIGSDQQDPQGNLVAIVGDAFLKNVLSVYSYSSNGSPAIGFASLSTSSANATVISTTTSIDGLITTRATSTATATNSRGSTGTTSGAATSSTVASSGAGSRVDNGVLGGIMSIAVIYAGLALLA